MQNEISLSQILRGSPIPTFVIDTNHVVTHCNPAFEKLSGLAAKDLIGTKNQWLAFYPVARPVLADFIVEGATEEKINLYYAAKCRRSLLVDGGYEAQNFFPSLDKKGKWIFFTAAPLRDRDGNIVGAIETLQDITDQKVAEQGLRESERRYRKLLDFVPYPTVVFTLNGRVSYLNPAFTETFGWKLEELEGGSIPYVPEGYEQETHNAIRKLFKDKRILRHETKRHTKNGRMLDVVLRAAIFYEADGEPAGELVILRDITREKRIAQSNDAMLRISMALPEYPDLQELLDYVSSEIKRLLGTEAALVTLLDEEAGELYFPGVAYDDNITGKRVKETRFPLDQLIAGRVLKSGEPLIVSDVSMDREIHEARDRKLGYRTHNLLLVPLRSIDRIIGVIAAINKKNGDFDQTDVELLSMIAATVVLSIENARFSDEIRKAYREVSNLNRAKDKVINHLSHELKTPASVLAGSLDILERKLSAMTDHSWNRTLQRARNNVERILEIQYVVDDIMQNKHYETRELPALLLDHCIEEMEAVINENEASPDLANRMKTRLKELLGPPMDAPHRIKINEFAAERLKALAPKFAHRSVNIVTRLEEPVEICIPEDPLKKTIDGLVKNAVENTPDEGKIEIEAVPLPDGEAVFTVRDYGVGIPDEAKKHIFEGFFTTQDTLNYSSKRPFDFNAGGKGADLLRIKVFSERYGFDVHMESTRCPYIPQSSDTCEGSISACPHCKGVEDCMKSGGTLFSLTFRHAGRACQ
ncbi:MAG: PAS domain S-box protein [Desulfatiglandaceae bacterium]